MSMLLIRELTASYDTIPALQKVSVEVRHGSITAILGANGAGKSTLLKTVSGLIENKTGSIVFDGQEIMGLATDRIVALGLSQVAEGRQIFSHMTVADNVQLGAYLHHKRRKRGEIKRWTEEVYALFPILARRSGQVAGTLSGGEQQMLAIARALMTRPRMLLLDEPSMGLAPIVVQEIFAIINKLNQDGMTILLVEQNARTALQIADYGYVLETGHVALEGPSTQLLHDKKVKAAYLGG